MKVNLEINNTTQSLVSDEFLVSVAEETFRVLNYDFFDGKELIISLALVPPEEIKNLNKEYRKFDTVTDVLSFPEYRNIAEVKMAIGEARGNEMFLGELILCYDDIREYAQKENIALNKELANVIAHGILHLLGFAHGEEMFAVQDLVKGKF
jgi:probable rRNA maturation factor